MRKVISIVCSVVLCMSIVLASVGQVSALENADVANREEQISALFDEMTENLALSLLNEAIADESSVSVRPPFKKTSPISTSSLPS